MLSYITIFPLLKHLPTDFEALNNGFKLGFLLSSIGVGTVIIYISGLISKVWLSNTETGTFGGVYTWESKSDMDNYLASELFSSVKNDPNLANVKSLDYGILESATRVTRGIS